MLYSRSFAVLSFLAVLAAALPAAAGQKDGGAVPAVRAQVLSLLASTKETPTCEDWKGLGKGAVEVLSERLASGEEAPALRTRAAFGLGCFEGNVQAAKALRAAARDEKLAALVRNPALVSLAKVEKEKAIPEIEKALSAGDPMTRLAGVEAAEELGKDGARRVLQKRLAKEPLPVVQNRMREAMGEGAKGPAPVPEKK
ncbi:MAG: HEAT repeat domain-containing protein [Bdellovibrionota bacterium]